MNAQLHDICHQEPCSFSVKCYGYSESLTNTCIVAQEILCWDALSGDTVLKASRDLVWSPVKAFVCVGDIVIVCVSSGPR